MPACRITVLKTMLDQDLAEEYRRPDMGISPCTYFLLRVRNSSSMKSVKNLRISLWKGVE